MRGSVDNKYQYLKADSDARRHDFLENQLLTYVDKYFDENSMHTNLIGSSKTGNLEPIMEEDDNTENSMIVDSVPDDSQSEIGSMIFTENGFDLSMTPS